MPETVAWEIVVLDFPVLLMATGAMELLPTCTLPKFTLVESTDIWAFDAPEMINKEKKRSVPHSALKADPKRVIVRSLARAR